MQGRRVDNNLTSREIIYTPSHEPRGVNKKREAKYFTKTERQAKSTWEEQGHGALEKEGQKGKSQG